MTIGSGFQIQFAKVSQVKSSGAHAPTDTQGISFKEINADVKAKGNEGLFGPDLHADIMKIQNQLVSGKSLKPQEMLLYQMKVGQFGIRVEFVSKIAESALSTARKLQNPQ